MIPSDDDLGFTRNKPPGWKFEERDGIYVATLNKVSIHTNDELLTIHYAWVINDSFFVR